MKKRKQSATARPAPLRNPAIPSNPLTPDTWKDWYWQFKRRDPEYQRWYATRSRPIPPENAERLRREPGVLFYPTDPQCPTAPEIFGTVLETGFIVLNETVGDVEFQLPLDPKRGQRKQIEANKAMAKSNIQFLADLGLKAPAHWGRGWSGLEKRARSAPSFGHKTNAGDNASLKHYLKILDLYADGLTYYEIDSKVPGPGRNISRDLRRARKLAHDPSPLILS
jgi:hypothetical protein